MIFSIPGMNGQDLFNRLYSEHHIAGARSGAGVRLSPHITTRWKTWTEL